MIYINCKFFLLFVINMACITGANVLINRSTPSTTFEIPYSNINILCNSTGSPTSKLSLIFTQGATGDLSSPAVANFVDGFSELKKILSFRGRSNLKERTKMFKAVMEHNQCDVIGGRSMGSRVSIATAKETGNLKALILISFPLKSKIGEDRHHLLRNINEAIDILFVIGSRDQLCDLNDLRLKIKQMKNKVWLVVVKNANHFMEIGSPSVTRAVGKMVGKVVARWIEERNEKLTIREIQWDEEQNNILVGPWKDEL